MSEHGQEVLADRFDIKEKIGSGGMGVVYRAHDRERGVDVALKTLRNFDGAALYRFKKEFRALADIVHPNLVTLHELVSVGEEWFFTMELVDGISFLEYVRPHEVKPTTDSFEKRQIREITPLADEPEDTLPTEALSTNRSASRRRDAIAGAAVDLDRLTSASAQLVDAVQAIHSANKLHRDLKPSNVLVTPQGRVVLCDFGLIAEAREAERTVELATVGTPAYMAPEHAAGRAVSEASDWYSVGVMLYEALTGHLPFSGTSREIAQLKNLVTAPSPKQLDESIPDHLDELCTSLLALDAAKRPGYRAIREVFGGRASTASAAIGPIPQAGRFVGRERHLEALRTAFADSRGGSIIAAFVHGPSGMGKTALVSTFLEEVAAEREAVILQGRCYERESVPYKALDTLVDSLSNYLLRLDPDEVDPLIPRDILPLARLFPVLRRVKAVAEPKVRSFEPPDPQEIRHRAFGALRHLLRQLGAQRPVILYIDDLQWGDVDSAAFLNDLIHHPRSPSVLLIASYRREDIDTSPLLRALLRPAAEHTGDVRELAVDELSGADARALVCDIIGKDDERRDSLVEAVLEESGRNPLFLAELAHAASESAGAEVVSIDEVLRRRVRALPDDARALLTVAAVAAQPLSLRVAASAAGVTNETPVLARLRAARLLRTRRGGGRYEVEPYHDRVRETVVSSLSPARLEATHRMLVAALEKSHRSDLQALVDHCLGAGDLDKAGRYAARAAVQAEGALAFDRAAHYFGLALRLQELTGAKRRARQKRMADALANAGKLLDAADTYLGAAVGAEPEEALELRRRAVEQLLHGGRLEQGLEVTKLVVDEVGLRLPRSQRKALWSVAWLRLWIRLRGLRFKQRRAKDVPAETLKRLDVCWATSSGLSFVDPMLGKAYQMRHLLDSLKAGEPYRISLAMSLEMGYLALAGGKARVRVEALYQRNLELAARIRNPHAIGMCYGVGGVASFLYGRWRDSRERVTIGEKTLRDNCIGVRFELGIGKVYHMASLFYLGEIAELTRKLPVLLREAVERGDQYAANGLRAWRSNVAWLVLDEPDEAREQSRAGALVSARDDFHLHHYYELLATAQTDLYEGKTMEAWKRVSERWKPLSKSLLLRIQSVRIEGACLRARCALATAVAGHDREGMLGEAERAARRIEKERMMWGNPLAKLIRAGVAQTRGDADTAADLLGSAIVEFEAADMALLAAVARRCLGELIGGDEGRVHVDSATEWMRRESIRAPERMTNMLAPGFLLA